MCGIVGFIGESPALPILLEGLEKLEYRGYDSAGIAIMENGEISIKKASGRISELQKKAEESPAQGSLGIGHTRWATHGAPTDANAHPHLSASGLFAVVHNGIIENYLELKETLEKEGYRFKSETDTEVIAHLLEKNYNGDIKETIRKTVSSLSGSYALGIICKDAGDRLYAVKKASPLILGIGKGENFFASDITALINHTRNVIYLEDGEFAEITCKKINIYSPSGEIIEKQTQRIGFSIEAAEKQGFEHFMLKEIYEQPKALESAISPRIRDGKIDLQKIDLKGIKRIIITACGSAYYAGVAGALVIERLCRIPVSLSLASELRYSDPISDENTLLIALSQSGETADTIAALKECKKRGTKALSIVNVLGSTVASLSDYVLYMNAGPEIAVATTKGYSTQLSLLYLLAIHFADTLGRIDKNKYSELLEELKRAPSLLENALKLCAKKSEALAKKYCKAQSIFFIGRGADYAAALEGALKLKEISYIHAEAYPAGELKHGTIALIEENTPVIALLSCDEVFDKTLSNTVEAKSRGAKILGIVKEGDDRANSVCDDIIFIPRLSPLFSPLAEIIPLQLFAYFVAKERGCDIDKPKNLAKSVTVE